MGTTQPSAVAGGIAAGGAERRTAGSVAAADSGTAARSGAGTENSAGSTAMVALEATPLEERNQNIGEEPLPISPVVARLPVQMDVVVPVRDFRVRNLLTLEAGQVIESQWSHGDDVPLTAGEIPLAWTEFEVMETELAVRITRLA